MESWTNETSTLGLSRQEWGCEMVRTTVPSTARTLYLLLTSRRLRPSSLLHMAVAPVQQSSATRGGGDARRQPLGRRKQRRWDNGERHRQLRLSQKNRVSDRRWTVARCLHVGWWCVLPCAVSRSRVYGRAFECVYPAGASQGLNQILLWCCGASFFVVTPSSTAETPTPCNTGRRQHHASHFPSRALVRSLLSAGCPRAHPRTHRPHRQPSGSGEVSARAARPRGRRSRAPHSEFQVIDEFARACFRRAAQSSHGEST